MRIVIAVVGSSEYLSGVSRHAANMARCLLKRAEVSEVHLIAAQWQYDSLYEAVSCDAPGLHIHSVSPGRSALSRNFWYYVRLPLFAEKLGADIVHCAYPVPLNRSAFQCPTVVTLHDLYPYDIPANFGFPKVLLNRMILKQCLRAVDAIACVSQSTLGRLDAYAPQYALQKAVTIYNCVEPGPPMAAQSPLPSWRGEPFLLCVAQHRRNKNVLLAVEVFQKLLVRREISSSAFLVIIGMEGPETARIHRLIDEAGLARQVVLLQGVSDAELQWCYGHCELLLAPSIIEGFGLPVVEAMLHHCRIVCSDIPAFREVGGAYCLYASLQPPAEDTFVSAVRTAFKNIKFRPAATDRFSSPCIAEAYLRLYTHLRNGCSVFGSCNHSDLVHSSERKSVHDHEHSK